jgi:phosphoribosylaminoimidazole-succinocarboxamide synthase
MEKLQQLYEGKAKKVFATEDPNVVIVDYKDDATAFNGLKKGTIAGKGVINNKMSNFMMRKLEEAGVPTHYIEQLSDRETAVKKVTILPLEVIVRNISAGSFAKHYGVKEGIVFDEPTIEFSYKNDDLGDPLLNEYHAVALKLATWDEIALVKKYAFQVNDFLKSYLKGIGIDLVDFKVEFGKPEAATRAKIWASMLDGLSGEDALTLATRYDFSGGNIENIARKATVGYVLTGRKAGLEELVKYCDEETLSSQKGARRIGFNV